MHLTKDALTLVLAGSWNRELLTPAWMLRYGLRLEEGAYNIGISSPLFSPAGTIARPIYTLPGMSYFIMPGSLVLRPAELTEDGLTALQGIAQNILGELKHTPVSAGGYNFGFEFETPGDDVLESFRNAQQGAVDSVPDGWQVSGNIINTSLSKAGNSLNVQKSIQEGKVSLAVNFNMPATTTDLLGGALLANPLADVFTMVKAIAQNLSGEDLND